MKHEMICTVAQAVAVFSLVLFPPAFGGSSLAGCGGTLVVEHKDGAPPDEAVCSDAPDGSPCEAGTCDDGDPCTQDMRSIDGCVHESICDECDGLPNGWSCDYPKQGACLDGVCVPGE